MNEKEKYVVETLRAVKEELERRGVTFWLDSGGLLGAVREGRLIPWDHDVEVGVWEGEIPKVLDAARSLLKRGFVVDYIMCPEGEMSVIVSKDSRRWVPVVIEIHVDLGDTAGFGMFGSPNGNGRLREIFRRGMKYLCSVITSPYQMGSPPPFVPKIIHISLHTTFKIMPEKFRTDIKKIFNAFIHFLGYRWRYSKVPTHYYLNFDEIEFYGMKFKTPAPLLDYIEFRYGKDWRIPKRDWSTARDDGNMAYARGDNAD